MATYDLLTIGEARDALGLDPQDTTNQTLLAAYITAISSRLDDACGPIVQRTITGETYSGGRHTIWLKKTPVVSITSVTEYEDLTPTTLSVRSNTSHPSNGYMFDQTMGTISRFSSALPDYFEPGIHNIAVTYVAGRYTTTNTVSELFKIAAGAFLSHVWKMNQGMGTQTFGEYDVSTQIVTFALPKRVLDLLGNEVLAPGFA